MLWHGARYISTISLCPAYRSICDACGKEYHWRKVCRASKFIAKGINVQVVVAKGILRHLRKNRVQRSIFMALKLMMKLKTALVYHFPISCIFIPYQPGHERWHSSFRGGSGVWSVHEITLVQSWHRRWGERYFIKYLLFPESPYNDNVTPTNL